MAQATHLGALANGILKIFEKLRNLSSNDFARLFAGWCTYAHGIPITLVIPARQYFNTSFFQCIGTGRRENCSPPRRTGSRRGKEGGIEKPRGMTRDHACFPSPSIQSPTASRAYPANSPEGDDERLDEAPPAPDDSLPPPGSINSTSGRIDFSYGKDAFCSGRIACHFGKSDSTSEGGS